MACSTDFKNLHDLYQSEGVPKGISIVHFCQMNGIVYKHYERWHKNYHSAKIIPVEVVSRDGLSEPSLPQALPVSAPVSASVISSFDIRFSNGLHIHNEQLDYRSFCALVEKLEVLC